MAAQAAPPGAGATWRPNAKGALLITSRTLDILERVISPRGPSHDFSAVIAILADERLGGPAAGAAPHGGGALEPVPAGG